MGCNRSISSAQDNKKVKAEYHKISAEKAHKMMMELNDFILLDVRTDEEYAEKHIGGAVLIPDYEIEDRADGELPDKNAVILIYCRSGRRSENAARTLVDRGYTRVYDFGGILNWPYETVSK
ncbi:MAG: rhodanese-like domain-containing protein [Treponema sp.]|nr:rhodanese-like domain-containing protein [Treponema sp.]